MKNKAKIILLGAAIAAALALSGCEPRQIEYGTLEGIVSIGPLCPVETNPPDPLCLPSQVTYEAWPIAVYSAGHKEAGLIRPLPPGGAYSLQLSEGKYTVNLMENIPGGIGSSNLPAEITIYSGKTTTLNIDIDTGMR